MPKDITVFDSILKKFATLPKCDTSPTFMELCQLGNDRFEERCSNILKFYLSPDAPHGLHELFIKSLLELTGHGDLAFEKVHILTEEMTSDRKFIDITVVTDSFVIAIENKITASLYNRLDL
ncbi:MAG: PD-(D/E)XK nuclease family protein, partial [Muribaculaceae bacterium]|nr:PD-(D/E)XK nuclease family protein [Muribaculaceae bacterium]